MKKVIFLLISLLFICLLAQSQTYFQKTIGGPNNDECRAVKQTSDGGFIFAGKTQSFGAGSIDIMVVKTDVNGDTTWVKTYGVGGSDDGYDIIETVSGNFILLGQTNSYGASDEVFLLNLDINGNIIWAKTYGGSSSDRGIRVQQTPDLGYIISGITFSFGNNGQFYLIKTDNAGVLQWTNTYGGSSAEYLYGMDQTIDGGYVMVGQTASFGQGSSDVLVVKVNASGNEVWSGSYGMGGSEYGYYIEETSDNGFAIIGQTSSFGAGARDVLLLKLDSSGTLLWTKTYGSSSSSDWGWEVHETPDLGFILMCQTGTFGFGSSEGYVIRTDNLGNHIWSKVYGGTQSEYFLSGCVTNDNGYMFTSISSSFGAGGVDFYMVKTDSLGNVYGCYTRPAATIVNSAPFIQASTTLLTSPGGIENTVAPSSLYTSALKVDICPCFFNDSLTIVDENCYGDTIGSVYINVWGGNTPYSYLWSTLSTNDTINNLASGDYYVVVSDYYGCSVVDSATVTQPSQLIDTLLVSHLTCFSSNDGSIISNIYGGTFPYNYLWSNNDTLDTLSNLSGGWYYLTLTDNNLCTLVDSIEVIEPPELFIDSMINIDVLCYGDNSGSASVYTSGGTPPYSYLWSNGIMNDTIINLLADTFYITVTDYNGCFKDSNVVISQPPILTDTIIYQNVLCFNDINGWAISQPSGGLMPYSYSWSNGSTNDSILNLYPDTFYLTLTDFNGCILNDSVIITQPDALENTITQINVSCYGFNDASAIAFPYGGTNPYYYEWSTDNDTLNFLDSLTAGLYYITITDTNNCIVIDTVQIGQPPELQDSISHFDLDCFGDNDAYASIFVLGGTIPYEYQWSTQFNDTISNVDSLIGGLYYITVIDDHNCILIDSVEILEPALLEVPYTYTDILCNGDNDGDISIQTTGGVLPYSYMWSTSFNDTLNLINNLNEGLYSVTITDNNGCSQSISDIEIHEPPKLTLFLDGIMPLCNGDSNGVVNSYVDGGVKTYSYMWSEGQTDSVLTGITSNLYYLTVTDANSCTIADSIILNEPTALVLYDSIYIQEYLGNIDLTISGGTAPYGFLWSDDKTYEDNFYLISGEYQVTVSDINGCQITGDYTINIPFVIPSLITPNNDGFNDNWKIANLNYYPEITIEIFNRWGDVVFEFSGSGFDYDTERWDGTYKGQNLPMGSYVYIINLNNGLDPYNGVVTIKR